MNISRGEVAWAGLLAAGVVMLSTMPYLLAWWLTPPGYVFTGILANPMDAFSYLAKMREATQGAWLLHLPYASEPHPGALLYPQYVFLGKVVALTGFAPVFVFHGGRILAGLLLLGASYALIVAIVSDAAARRTAFMLLTTSGGLTWATSSFGFLAADVMIPESNTFHSLFSSVHFPLATGLLVLVALVGYRSFPAFRWSRMALAGALNAVVVLLQPFMLFSEALVGAVWAALLLVKRKLPWEALRPAVLLAFAIPAPILVLLMQELYGDPVLAQWTAQNITLSPLPWSYLAGYGLLAPLALMGLVAAWRHAEAAGLTDKGALLLVAWVVAIPPALYLPVAWQRRLSEGYHIPLSLLAAVGLHYYVLARLEGRARGYVRALTIGFGALGSLFLAATMVYGAGVALEPQYLSHDDSAALGWLSRSATANELVLASPTIGNLVPAWSDARVYWGHPFETLDAIQKRQHVVEFYDSGTSAEARCAFLRAAGVTMVYAGPVELGLGGVSFEEHPGLEVLHRSGRVTIFKVVPCTTAQRGSS